MNENKVKLHINTDIVIVGTGVGGLFTALNLPRDKQIVMITKADLESSDSFLAQGGICVLKNEDDYDSYFEDTMKAGHYENDKKSVEIMIRSSAEVVKDLVDCGARFAREADGSLAYTREGAHSSNRIIFHEDITGKEITSHLLEKVRTLPNVTIMEYTRLLDIISRDNRCLGAVIRTGNGELIKVEAADVVLATGGIGGLYRHSTNFRHLTGDAIAIAIKHGVELKDINYVQIHPTTFYSDKEEDRSFLISESVRGEGAKLYDKNGKRFVNELLPRDLLTEEIRKQMAKDNTDFVWEDLRTIPEEELKTHFAVPFIEKAKALDAYISVQSEAAVAVTSGVSAMHDVTEGGIFGALWEMAEASGVGLEIDLKKIPIRQETVEVCEFFGVNPYLLISSGCMLMAAQDGNHLVRELEKAGIKATIIGKATAGNDRVLLNEDERRFLEPPKTDELYKVIGR